MLKITELSLRRGSRLLLDNVELDIFPGQRMGLTGANGSGKSSLFAVIAGRLEADKGTVTLPRGTLITEVLQETPDSDRKAIDYVIDGDQLYRSLELKIAKAESDDNGTLLATLHSQMDDIDGFRVSARAGQLLHGLGFSAKEQNQSVNTFSVWLERWLTNFSGIVLVISHDREFLDRAVTRIARIENRTVQVYEGNYSLAEERRAAWIAIQHKQHLRQQKQVRHMRSYIDRFRYKASKARQAQSRLKALERMEMISPVHQKWRWQNHLNEDSRSPTFASSRHIHRRLEIAYRLFCPTPNGTVEFTMVTS